MDFFRTRLLRHVSELEELRRVPEKNIMLISISSAEITADQDTKHIPGEGYHQDGRGIPISTKITLISKNVWKGGELHLEKLSEPDAKALVGKSPIDFPGTYQELVDYTGAIIFDNKELLHAVRAPQFQERTGTRAIYQERINDAEDFNYLLLDQFGFVTPLSNSIRLSAFSGVLSNFLNPRAKGLRYKEEDDLSQPEIEYRKTHETPDKEFQEKLSQSLGDKFSTITDQLERDGVVILPSFFDEQTTAEMQEFFNDKLSHKATDPLLGQNSFNGSVDKEADLSSSIPVAKSAVNDTITSVISHYMGAPVVLANWRGYRLQPSHPLLYRAWDWHNDQKRKEVKVMVLLSDVPEDGQAMQVIKGSHKHWWNLENQADTKYSIDEALDLGGDEAITKCYGKKGTIIFFDTNIVHRGIRGPMTRDVMTFNFLPNVRNAAVFDMSAQEQVDGLSHLEKVVLHMEEVQDDKEFYLREVDSRQVKEKLETQIVIDKEQDTDEVVTAALVEEYHSTPHFDDVKPRYTDKDMPFSEFLAQNANYDFASDLDLPVRMGSGDVDRDVLFASFRDGGSTSELFKKLKERLLSQKPQQPVKFSVEDLVQYAQEVIDVPDQNHKLQPHVKLAGDLKESLLHLDSTQRLRTNILYLYAIYEDINKSYPSDKIEQKINNILQCYANVVYMDDTVHERTGESQTDTFKEVSMKLKRDEQRALKSEKEPETSAQQPEGHSVRQHTKGHTTWQK